jgi:hypothetical protein
MRYRRGRGLCGAYSCRVDIAICQLETATLDMPVTGDASPNHSIGCHAMAHAISSTRGLASVRVKVL